jgi:hypothetical protein
MAAAKLAVLVQPPGRGHRIARALESHGYRVALHRNVDSAQRCLRRARTVALLFVDQGGRWFAGNDLLSALDDFPSMRGARVFVTLENPNSVFAEALRVRGASVLVHPISYDHIAAIAFDGSSRTRMTRLLRTRADFLRLRDEAERLCIRALRALEASRQLRRAAGETRRSAGR